MPGLFEKLMASQLAKKQALVQERAPQVDPQEQLAAWLHQKQQMYERSGADPAMIPQWQEQNRARYEDNQRQQQSAQTRAQLPPAIIQWMLSQGRAR